MNRHMFHITLRENSSFDTSLADENKSESRITYKYNNQFDAVLIWLELSDNTVINCII